MTLFALDRRAFLGGALVAASSAALAQSIGPRGPGDGGGIGPGNGPGPGGGSAPNGGTGSGWRFEPGARIVWLGAAASIAGTLDQIEPDANGDWINKATGSRFSVISTPTASGAGYFVADIEAADRNGFLIWSSSLLIVADAGGATSLVDAFGLAASAQNLSDYWIAPDELAKVAEQNSGGVRITRLPYNLDGHTYRAIRVQTHTGNGWIQNTYDLDTGLSIVSSSTAQGRSVPVLAPGRQITFGAGNTQLTYSKLIGTRRVALPGPGSVYPDAIRRLRTIDYSGTTTTILPGSPQYSIKTSLRYEIQSNSGAYLQARAGAPGTQGSVDRVIPAGVVGSLWMDPQVLNRFRNGQVIDRDQWTGLEVVAGGQQGNLSMVALRTPMATWTFGYDMRSGLLTRGETRTRLDPATTVVSLQLAGAR